MLPPSNFVFDIDTDSFRRFVRRLEDDFSFLRLSRTVVDGETVLESGHGGMRIFCLYRGEGEVFLPQGYRTQEGDGAPLPSDIYRPDPVEPSWLALLRRLREEYSSISPQASVPVEAVLNRLDEDAGCFRGDVTGELWRLLEQAPRPWASDAEVEKDIDTLFRNYREQGFSTKTVDSWETIKPGDQLVVTENRPLRVRGEFRCFSLENIERKTSHVSAVRRLRFLLDTAGGCSPGFDPFRRLPVTWYPNYPGEAGDGLNFFNNHIVNIPGENSPTHFHPKRPIGGGMAQAEFYLVLDPGDYYLSTDSLEPLMILYPDLNDLTRFEQHRLKPGDLVYMPAGTGHRGLNVFAAIMTVPGFKPGNELYLDRDIFERTDGRSPYNENHLKSKNYECLEDFL